MNHYDEASPDRPRHPIGVVAERTGLTQEVLRVWERRYGVVAPARAEGGRRLYSDADVDRLRLLRSATRGGRSIGAVAPLPVPELIRLVREDEAAREDREDREGREPVGRAAPPAVNLDAAMAYTRTLDARGLEGLLRRTAALTGALVFLERMAAPLLRAVGDEWHAGRLSPAQEHVATEVVQRVVIHVLGMMHVPDDAPVFLVGGPAGDRHGMGALLAAAAGASESWRVVYLGPDLPAADIVQAAMDSGARAVGLSVVFVDDRRRVVGEIREVRDGLPATVPLLVGGAGAAPIRAELDHSAIRVLEDLDSLRSALRRLSPRKEG
jgi:MerR family transcriptional regulator, light-induced transcriptional regulator